MVRRAVLAVAPNDQGVPQRSAAPIESAVREPMNLDSHPLVVSVCYFRLSASELNATARVAADIFALNGVAVQNGVFALRYQTHLPSSSLTHHSSTPSH